MEFPIQIVEFLDTFLLPLAARESGASWFNAALMCKGRVENILIALTEIAVPRTTLILNLHSSSGTLQLHLEKP